MISQQRETMGKGSFRRILMCLSVSNVPLLEQFSFIDTATQIAEVN